MLYWFFSLNTLSFPVKQVEGNGMGCELISTEAAGKPHSKSSLVDDKSLLEWDQDARCYSLLNMRDVTRRQQEASKTKVATKLFFSVNSLPPPTPFKMKKAEHSSLMILSLEWKEKKRILRRMKDKMMRRKKSREKVFAWEPGVFQFSSCKLSS